ncbi:MAG: LamG-like jellyroll fold domain-containing protein [Verrucomicrobiota bacterium]
MSTVHICLNDILGVAVACEVIFYPGDTPFSNGSALAVSGARSIWLDAGGNGSVTLLPGHYTVRFSGITGNTDTLLILVPNEEGDYQLAELLVGGHPQQDFLQKANNLSDVADPATAFDTIKQAATATMAGVVCLATQAEVDAGTEAAKCVTPATLAHAARFGKVRMITVSDATGRFALTPAQVDVGDLVEQTDTLAVYQVLDTALLDIELGYVQIGTRAAVPINGLMGGLLAFWRLDEETGVRVDATGNGTALSDNNGVGFTAGKIGNAASFDGSNYLSTSQQFDPTQSYTVVCWVKLDSPTHDQDCINIGANGLFMQLDPYCNAQGGPGFNPGINEGYIVGIPDWVGDDQPHFLAAMVDANTGVATLYVDGQSASQMIPSQILAIPGPLILGGAFTNPLAGWIDEVGIWNRALSDAEISRIYNNGNGNAYPFA